MKKIKVLQVCYSLKAAGIETFVSNLQQNIDISRFEVHFLVYKNSKMDSFYREKIEHAGGIVKDASATNTKLFLLRHIKQRINYCRFLQNEKYDIVHVHASSGLQGLEVFLAHLKGCKKIVVHSHSSNLSAATKFNRLKRCVHIFGIKWIKRYSAVNLACSEKAAKWLFPGQNDVRLIYNGIQCQNYKFSSECRKRVREELAIKDTDLVLGHIGAFSNIKNHEFILKVFKKVKNDYKSVKLILIGDGQLKSDMVELSKRLGIFDDVYFLGIRNDCNTLLMAMDCFVFPSIFEGLPITLVEAQASGVPCIVSDSITRQVELCENIKFISLDDGEEVWKNIILAEKINSYREKSASVVGEKGFDMKESSIIIENIYSSLCN